MCQLIKTEDGFQLIYECNTSLMKARFCVSQLRPLILLKHIYLYNIYIYKINKEMLKTLSFQVEGSIHDSLR